MVQFSPALKVLSSKRSASACRSYASSPCSRGTAPSKLCRCSRFWLMVCMTMLLKVARSMAHKAASDVATTEAARGALYMRASSPKVLPAVYSSTRAPMDESSEPSTFC